MLNYSAVVLPVSRADKAVDQADPAYSPVNDTDRANWEACKSILPIMFPSRSNWLMLIDDADVYHGAPIGVQVITRKFQEEKALAIAKIVHESLGSPRLV